MKQLGMAVLTILLVSGTCMAGNIPAPKEETGKINYSVGYQIGGDFKRQKVGLDAEALLQGIRDALGEEKPLLSSEEMRTVLVGLKKRIDTDSMERKKAASERLRGEGREFLAMNAGKEGVITLQSGLQYKVIKEGTGKKPTLKDRVTVNYRATRIDGQEFDSSDRDGKPTTIPLSGVIPGWKEALPLMKEGARWQLFIPSDLAFGERGPLADRAVIYEIELIAVKPGQ